MSIVQRTGTCFYCGHDHDQDLVPPPPDDELTQLRAMLAEALAEKAQGPVGEVVDPTFVHFYEGKQFPYGTLLYLAPPTIEAAEQATAAKMREMLLEAAKAGAKLLPIVLTEDTLDRLNTAVDRILAGKAGT